MISEKFLSLSFVLVLIASNYLISCNNEGFFTVAGVSLLKSQQVYRVSVAHQGYKDDKSLQIGIKEVKENSTGLEFYKNVTLSGDGVQNIDFDVGIIAIYIETCNIYPMRKNLIYLNMLKNVRTNIYYVY